MTSHSASLLFSNATTGVEVEEMNRRPEQANEEKKQINKEAGDGEGSEEDILSPENEPLKKEIRFDDGMDEQISFTHESGVVGSSSSSTSFSQTRHRHRRQRSISETFVLNSSSSKKETVSPHSSLSLSLSSASFSPSSPTNKLDVSGASPRQSLHMLSDSGVYAPALSTSPDSTYEGMNELIIFCVGYMSYREIATLSFLPLFLEHRLYVSVRMMAFSNLPYAVMDRYSNFFSRTCVLGFV